MFVVGMHEVDLLLGLLGPLVQPRDRHRVGSAGGGVFLLKEMSDDSLIGFIDVGLKRNQ